ncbi:MAG: transcription repressor NadR [Lachnospiraceae bacterium]
MTGEERRNQVLQTLINAKEPISGSALAKLCQVSRQIIVQDIALLRASDYDIFSTPKGYVIRTPVSCSRVYYVEHGCEEIEDELNTIVDLGGRIKDVMVEHAVYGSLKAPLPIRSRKEVKDFLKEISSGRSTPLMSLTPFKHSHTVEADSEEILDLIEKELENKGYLLVG